MRRRWTAFAREYLGVVLGVTITAVGLDWFLIPNRIAAGGVSGLATILFHTAGVPVGLSMLLINVPLFLLALKVLGPHFGVKTLLGVFVLSGAVDALEGVLPPLTGDPLLAALYGGVVTGLGMGLAFRGGGSTAGTDMAAQILHRLVGVTVGEALLVMDLFVIALGGIFFNVELALYALLSLFITSKTIDVVQEGRDFAKAAYIISERTTEIGSAVLSRLERGATYWQGRGMFTGQERQVLFVIVNRTELSALKELVQSIDPRAFMVIADVREVLGDFERSLLRLPRC